MDPRRFDALAKGLAPGLPRRRLLRRAGASAALFALGRSRPAAGQDEGETPEEGGRVVPLACEPCFCDAGGCECCLSGVTGGGGVRTAAGDAQLVLFASRLEEGSTDAAGFVRWFMPEEGDRGLTLESVGPIAYGLPDSREDREREIRGSMRANGEGGHPFVLRLLDAGPDALGEDTADLIVGDPTTDAGFAYEGGGRLVGGDLQLLGGVGPFP